MHITLTVSKDNVFSVVNRMTAYAGAKAVGDDNESYNRIPTIDEDEPLLSHFWDECKAEADHTLAAYIVTDNFEDLILNVHDTFNEELVPSIQTSLTNFFIYGIIARWYGYTNKEEAADMLARSTMELKSVLHAVMPKTFTRKMHPGW